MPSKDQNDRHGEDRLRKRQAEEGKMEQEKVTLVKKVGLGGLGTMPGGLASGCFKSLSNPAL